MVNHVVFADPNNEAARLLQADALEQLGYRAESGPWRNFYLTGAKEISSGEINIEGDREKLQDLLSLLDDFKFWFNIVTP